MDFFAQQDEARRKSRWLVLWYAAAVVLVVASYGAAAAGVYALVTLEAPPLRFHLVVAAIVSGFILAVSAYRMWQLSEGGPAIAEFLGARCVEPGLCTPAERKLLNVVEEMSIAARIPVPPVYMLDYDHAINALVAGHSPDNAVIVVTRGTVEKLSRDELQGMMGHEFSHILNGDMALNLRLVGLLGGLTFLGDYAERLIYRIAWANRGRPREKSGLAAPVALVAALIAIIAFPGTLAADAIKAAISRERERLADAASVQFTRNPDGVAGALDSILALRAPTIVHALHCHLFSHMFFAQAVARWWSPPTHPPITERIYRAHPMFRRDEYRERRHGTRREVAVIDGGGNVVKNLAFDRVVDVLSAAAQPPDPARRAEEAKAAIFALMRGESPERNGMLAIAEAAVPAIKAQPQAARDAFLDELTRLVEADRRMTLREFVLLTFLRQRLRAGAGEPIPTRFRRIEEVAADAHVVVSLVAVSGPDAQAAYARGAAVLGLGWREPLRALDTKTVGEALERLRHLAPLVKPGVLRACLEAARADGVFQRAQAELVRMVAATLDCPVPPALPA